MKIPSKIVSIAPLSCVGFIAGTLFVQAAEFTWNGSTSNDWATPANWQGGNVPSGTDIRINVGNSAVSTIDWDHRLIYSAAQGTTEVGGTGIRGLFIGNGSGTTGNMEITGGIINNIGNSSDGMSNGGGSATLVISGGEYNKTGGDDGRGTFSLNYGAGTALLRIESGSFNVTRLNFLESSGELDATGTIQLDGGVLSVGRFLKPGNSTISNHNVYLNGGTVASRLSATWADLANVTWTLQSKSTFDIGHAVIFAEALGGVSGFEKTGTGNFTLSGANTYTGVTTVSGTGALVLANNDALGASGAGNHTEVNSGARVVLNNGVTITGEALTISGDGGSGSLGALRAATNATATWDGAITTAGSEARIGAQNNGHLIVRGDIDASARNLIIRTEGNLTTPTETFDNTVVTLEGTYTGSQLVLFHGVVKLGASDRIQDTTVVNMGTSASTNIKQRLDLNGYSETIAGLIVSGSAASDTHEVTNSAATLSTLTLDSSDHREFSGIVTGNLAITKEGSNTVTFSGINTYSGTTSVNAGTFNVTTAGALNGGGSITVASGATFDLLGTYLFNIGENGVNNSITGAGSVNLIGILNFNLNLAALADENSWHLVDTSGSTTWNGVQVTSTAGDFTQSGDIWTLENGDSTWTFDQNTGVLSLGYIPEPSHSLLLLTGLAGCAMRRRRVG